jgi:hypothetical protein
VATAESGVVLTDTFTTADCIDTFTTADCIVGAAGKYSAPAAASSCTNRGTSQHTSDTAAGDHNAAADRIGCAAGK